MAPILAGKMRLLLVSGAVTIAGCASHPRGEAAAGFASGEIPLRLACEFDHRLERICLWARDPLDLHYMGALGNRWIRGWEPAPWYYNTWRLGYYEDAKSKRKLLPDLRSAAFLARLENFEVTWRFLFFLRIGEFRKADNVIRIRMGQHAFDVEVSGTGAPVDVDRKLPELGMSIREFIEHVERDPPEDGPTTRKGSR